LVSCCSFRRDSRDTYDLSVQIVLLDHDNVDCLGVFEGEETESSRSAGGAISHNSALQNVSKRGEVISKGFCMLVSNPQLNNPSAKDKNLRSVVSQFRPPMNIFL
jgi:hypothetical protein